MVWDPEHKSIDVRESIHLADIPTLYSKVLDQAKSLFKWLTEGIETALTFPYSNIVDDLNDATPDYSFLKIPFLFLEPYCFTLISYLIQSPRSVLRIADGDAEWNKVIAREWIRKAQELNGCLLFLIHLGSAKGQRCLVCCLGTCRMCTGVCLLFQEG